MNRTMVINLQKTPEKWVKLMLHLQNSLPGVFQLIFPDVETAHNANKRMSAVIKKYPTWFRMIICQRGCEIYVVKTQYVQKAVIKDE